MEDMFETIAAIATPISTGGIGVIRISGENALNAAQSIFDRKIKPKIINHGWIIENGKRIDEVIVLPFVKPKSFTGEDVVEIQTHGSPVIIRQILNLILTKGVRMAQRGEFTKRAFLNHKIDLSQAEAVLDLINAKTSKSANIAANNLSGALKKEIDNVKKNMKEILAKIIASLDFPEDVKEVEYKEIIEVCESSIKHIQKILSNASSHNVLREGIKIAVAGKPNVGKSSLFNALLNLDRAIVTDIAGTTRDTISETIEIKGISVTLTDTAGIREDNSIDLVEKIGVKNSKNIIEQSDIILCLFDASEGVKEEDISIFELIETSKKRLYVGTKKDKLQNDALPKVLNEGKSIETPILISSVTFDGIEKLKSAVFDEIIGSNPDDMEFITNQRQQNSLKTALEHLCNAKNASQQEQLQDLISIDIKSALISLGEISGEVVTDDILADIFESFCIGK